MHKAVVFTSNNARMIQISEDSDISEYKNIIINPDLSHVGGIPPHYWKVDRGHIIPMTDAEKIVRDDAIASDGIDNSASQPQSKPQDNVWSKFIEGDEIKHFELKDHLDDVGSLVILSKNELGVIMSRIGSKILDQGESIVDQHSLLLEDLKLKHERLLKSMKNSLYVDVIITITLLYLAFKK